MISEAYQRFVGLYGPVSEKENVFQPGHPAFNPDMSRDERGRFSPGGGGSPAAAHQRVMRIYESRQARYRALGERIARLQAEEKEALERVQPLYERLWSKPFGTPERVDAEAELAAAQETIVQPKSDAMWEAIDERQDLREEGRQEIWDALRADEPSVVPLQERGASDFIERAPAVRKGTNWFAGMVQTDAFEGKPEAVVEIKQGARASGNAEFISLSLDNKAGTVVHELGHALEGRDPAVHAAAVSFWEARTAGEEDRPIGEFTPSFGNYRSDEVGRGDKFIDGYMGKVYRTEGRIYATEIVSQGLSWMHDAPGELAAKDPEYFRFMVSVMSGRPKP